MNLHYHEEMRAPAALESLSCPLTYRVEFNEIFNRVFFCLLSVTVTKFIRIGIADKNDNPPYFDKGLYEAEVDENEDIQHTVLTVTAKDHDECKWNVATISANYSEPSY